APAELAYGGEDVHVTVGAVVRILSALVDPRIARRGERHHDGPDAARPEEAAGDDTEQRENRRAPRRPPPEPAPQPPRPVCHFRRAHAFHPPLPLPRGAVLLQFRLSLSMGAAF